MAQRPPHRRPQGEDSSYSRRASGDGDWREGVPTEDAPAGTANGLTGIPRGIHCAAAAGGGEGRNQGQEELDAIAVDHFLDTLTQVALSIASRKLSKEKGETPCCER